MRIVLAGGGTGGHLFPGLALAGELRRLRPDGTYVFYGAPKGLEEDLVPAAGWPLELLATGRGGFFSWRRPFNPLRFGWAVVQCVARFRRARPDAVVALGGYAAAAPGLAARLLGIPLAVLEQNTIPGRVNRQLAHWARQFHSQFAEAEPRVRLPRTGRFFASGSPLREEFVRLAAEPPVDGQALLVMGGSQGARRLNEIVLDAAPFWAAYGVRRVIHVAGAAHGDAVREGYARMGWRVVSPEEDGAPPPDAPDDGAVPTAEVYGFCRDMLAVYRRSVLVVARSGASSLAEFAAAGLPAALVPLPTAKDDHQRVNAVAVARAGAALLLEETALTGEALANVAGPLFMNAGRRRAMADKMRALARPEAGAAIARHILELVSVPDTPGRGA